MIKPAHNKNNILVVDNDSAVSNLISLMLKKRGYNVTVVPSASKELIPKIKNIDLVLLDVISVDENTLRLCKNINAKESDIAVPIMIICSDFISKDIFTKKHIRINEILTKPLEQNELISQVDKLLRKANMFDNTSVISHADISIRTEIRRIINDELIMPYYQPIFLYDKLKIIGIEALCRVATNGFLSDPEILFRQAIAHGMYEELEFLSCKKSLEHAAPHIKDKFLFLNCNERFIEGAKFLSVRSIFEDIGIDVRNTFFEISQRSQIQDFKLLNSNVEFYRTEGFRFAVDNVGQGNSSLESIVRIKPEVIKIDKNIIRDSIKDSYKRSMVKFIIAFCQENKILSVAEGIESQEDLEFVGKLGVDAVQGYYLCHPTPRIDFKEMKHSIEYT